MNMSVRAQPTDNWQALALPEEIRAILEASPSVRIASSIADLIELAAEESVGGIREVSYDVPGRGRMVEARVCRVRNGISANYLEPYMRRRDPDCLFIGDERPTNKTRFSDRFGGRFVGLRKETFEWLKAQDLVVFAYTTGISQKGLDSLVVAPANAGFFALGLALLQGIRRIDDVLNETFSPRAVIFVAPPFRHTHFEGKQVVVHNRTDELHELFSYHLYPGPSAKKGIYGLLLALGEQEGWITAHCSTIEATTPYEHHITIMHEGASGGGKSEMLEQIYREDDGSLLLGENMVTGERRTIVLPLGCEIRPVISDMALCPSDLQRLTRKQKLVLIDAEDAWFIRVNHIDRYGRDLQLERLTAEPPEPLLFLNIDAVPNSRALIFEHVEDEPGVPCPNPRVVVPRRIIPGIVDGPIVVDVRSFGFRCPPCIREHPTYGILGLFHVLPTALAWLWRLTAPRGHASPNPSDPGGITSEGVGSYWPFATGRRVDQANLLLNQIMRTSDSLYVLCPNQHIGAWKVGFMPQWIAREYLARRSAAPFRPDQLVPARCALLGFGLQSLQVEGTPIGHWFLRVESQPEVGEEAYDLGARALEAFFANQLVPFEDDYDLHPVGRKIIDACLSGATVEDYVELSRLGV